MSSKLSLCSPLGAGWLTVDWLIAEKSIYLEQPTRLFLLSDNWQIWPVSGTAVVAMHEMNVRYVQESDAIGLLSNNMDLSVTGVYQISDPNSGDSSVTRWVGYLSTKHHWQGLIWWHLRWVMPAEGSETLVVSLCLVSHRWKRGLRFLHEVGLQCVLQKKNNLMHLVRKTTWSQGSDQRGNSDTCVWRQLAPLHFLDPSREELKDGARFWVPLKLKVKAKPSEALHIGFLECLPSLSLWWEYRGLYKCHWKWQGCNQIAHIICVDTLSF